VHSRVENWHAKLDNHNMSMYGKMKVDESIDTLWFSVELNKL
jgi:hypothetical protein